MTAPFDRRRNAGPESSQPLIYSSATPSPSVSTKLVNGHAPSEAGPSRVRRDNVPTLDSAHTFLKTGLITQANGSGYIEVGRIKIACAVYGPRPRPPPFSALGSLSVELKFAPFSSLPRRAPLRDTEPAPLSSLLTSALVPAVQLHLLPKSAVDVFLVVLESGSTGPAAPAGSVEEGGASEEDGAGAVGRLLAAATTVASAALADAGVPMVGLAVGSVGSIPSPSPSLRPGSSSTTTPAHATASTITGGGQVQLSVFPALGKVAGLWMTGEAEVDDVAKAIEEAVVSARGVHTELGRALIEGFQERESGSAGAGAIAA